MAFEIMNLFSTSVQKRAIDEIEKLNKRTAKFGLILSRQEAIEIVETQTLALKDSGRIELGGGAIEKIIQAFCSSPYISKHNYAATIHELIEIFYYYKNETLDLLSDDDLIKFMRSAFDGKCQGSLELLAGRELAAMAREIRFRYDPVHSPVSTQVEEEKDGEY